MEGGYMDFEKDIKANDLSGIYKEIADVFGVETAIKFHVHFKGLQITFPSRLISKSYVLQKLKEEYTGYNLRELTIKYGYSERWLRTMIKNNDMEGNDGREE
jgi:Mor family transcriptional regulator